MRSKQLSVGQKRAGVAVVGLPQPEEAKVDPLPSVGRGGAQQRRFPEAVARAYRSKSLPLMAVMRRSRR
jgi:hypothetical protein